jgi:hypothetical protein
MNAAPEKEAQSRAGKYDLYTSVGVLGHLGITAVPENEPQFTNHVSQDFFFFFLFYVRYSALLYLPPLSCRM